jgi:uncharacterized membrane protein
MTLRKRAVRIATAVSFVGLVIMSLALEAYKPSIETNTSLYLAFFALGGVSLVLAWFAFANISRQPSEE